MFRGADRSRFGTVDPGCGAHGKVPASQGKRSNKRQSGSSQAGQARERLSSFVVAITVEAASDPRAFRRVARSRCRSDWIECSCAVGRWNQHPRGHRHCDALPRLVSHPVFAAGVSIPAHDELDSPALTLRKRPAIDRKPSMGFTVQTVSAVVPRSAVSASGNAFIPCSIGMRGDVFRSGATRFYVVPDRLFSHPTAAALRGRRFPTPIIGKVGIDEKSALATVPKSGFARREMLRWMDWTISRIGTTIACTSRTASNPYRLVRARRATCRHPKKSML
jgi:hypothetical protein